MRPGDVSINNFKTKSGVNTAFLKKLPERTILNVDPLYQHNICMKQMAAKYGVHSAKEKIANADKHSKEHRRADQPEMAMSPQLTASSLE